MIPEDIQILMSGYLDNQLTDDERLRLNAYLAESPEAQRELNRMQNLLAAASSLAVRQPPDDVWDTFLDNVYNRVERRTGWIVFTFGALILAAFGLYHFVMDPWTSALGKTLVATPAVGLGIVFISVLRQRIFVAKTDRYSRDVKR